MSHNGFQSEDYLLKEHLVILVQSSNADQKNCISQSLAQLAYIIINKER